MWFNNTRQVTVCLEIFGGRILAIFCSFPTYSPWKLDFLKNINSLSICEIRKSFIRNLLDFLRWLSLYLSDCKNIDNNLLYNCKTTNRPCSFWGKFCNKLSRRATNCKSLVWYILQQLFTSLSVKINTIIRLHFSFQPWMIIVHMYMNLHGQTVVPPPLITILTITWENWKITKH